MTASSAGSPAPNHADSSVRIVGSVAGILSGGAKTVVGQPFDIIKVRSSGYQGTPQNESGLAATVSPPGTYVNALDCLRRTVGREGPRALYKGGLPQLLGWCASDAVLLGSLHNYRLAWARLHASRRGYDPALNGVEPALLPLKYHYASGAMAGWTCSIVMTPAEHIKAKLQMQTVGTKLYSGPLDAARQVIAANGVFGMWRGFGGTLAMRTHIGGLFWFYQVQMRMFRSIPEESLWKPSNPVATFICGGFASTFFWLQALPFDAIKNRLQADSPTKPKYSSWFAAARQIWSEGGPKAFYRGFIPGMLRSFPTNGAALVVWETTMRLLGAEQLES